MKLAWPYYYYYYYDLLQAFKVEHYQLWVLNRGDLNFCTHSTPLWDPFREYSRAMRLILG